MNLSDLPNRIRKLMATVNQDDVALVSTLKTAAESFEVVMKTSSDIRYACEQEILATQRGVEIDNLRRDLALERQKVVSARKAEDEANGIIAKIAEAAECENFADIILARVTALAQQSNAMVRICEGHIANCRKAENTVARLNQNLSMVQNERDDARGQLQSRCDLLHEIADALNGPVNTCRDAVPARDWFMEKVEERVASRSYRRYLDVIGEAVGKPGLSYKDLAEYFRGLNVEGLKKIADKANETEVAAQQLHEADTRFIASVRDSLSYEILRRNKQ